MNICKQTKRKRSYGLSSKRRTQEDSSTSSPSMRRWKRKWGRPFHPPPPTRSCIGRDGERSLREVIILRAIPSHARSSKRLFPLILQKAQLEADLKKLRLRVLFEDEARFGRITRPADCWAPWHVRPDVPQQAIREYTYAFAALCPFDGMMDSLILPSMHASVHQLFLEELSKRHAGELLCLILDGAPGHKAGRRKLRIPDNIRLIFLPPYSPELNPVEHLWEAMREEHFCNCVFRSMDAVEKRLVTSLNVFEADHMRVQSLSLFSWMKVAGSVSI